MGAMTPGVYREMKFQSGRILKCWMCGCELTYGTSTVDHLIPKSKRGAKGKDNQSNYRLACKPCNSSRGNRRLTKVEQKIAAGRPPKKARDFGPLIAAIKRMNLT